ncbi:MAG: signal peptidase I [bacterium]|nr:signal peptidase I [bacterium]
MKIIKIIFELATWCVLGVIALMALYTITSNFNIFSGYRSYLVQSGSMEPAIMTGDIIVIHSQNDYVKNDVVTFHSTDNRIVTHRIMDIVDKNEQTIITTKGDANRSEDADTITKDKIIGKVSFIIPKLGYLVAFSKSLPGLIILAIIPIIMFILDELLKLKNA